MSITAVIALVLKILFVFFIIIKSASIISRKIIKKNEMYFLLILIFFALAIILSILNRYKSNDTYFYEDLDSSLGLISLILSPIIFSNYKIFIQRFNQILLTFFSIFSLFIIIIFLNFGKDSNFIIGASTLNYSIISLSVFYGLLNYEKGNKWGIITFLLGWLACTFTLSKWLFIVIFLSPILFLKIFIRNKDKTISYKKVFSLIFIVFPFFYYIISKSFDKIFQIIEFENILVFLSSRVFSGFDANLGIIQNLLDNDLRILDGSRFPIWLNLFDKFSESPLIGLGFGVRAFDLGVEDHNAFVFYLVRFGLIVSIPLTIFITGLFLDIFKNVKKVNNFNVYLIFLFLMLNVLLQSLTGMQWKSIPYIFFFGLFSSFFINFNENKIKQ